MLSARWTLPRHLCCVEALIPFLPPYVPLPAHSSLFSIRIPARMGNCQGANCPVLHPQEQPFALERGGLTPEEPGEWGCGAGAEGGRRKVTKQTGHSWAAFCATTFSGPSVKAGRQRAGVLPHLGVQAQPRRP